MTLGNGLPLLVVALAVPAALPGADLAVSAEERGRIERGLMELDGRLAKLRTLTPAVRADHLADATAYAKGATWALRYGEALTMADTVLLRKALERGNERAAALEAGTPFWAAKKGKVVRAFVSAVDGSVQPCGVVVPARYDPAKPIRLDVVLHGSSRPIGMSELRFLGRFDEGDTHGEGAPEQEYIELHPLGRVENCYRWAGETDVLEAIEAVCRNYNIDRDRIVVRGMSMGASATWHLGLKHPDRFVALGPYCGYVDTHHFSQTPLPNFVKVGPLPPQLPLRWTREEVQFGKEHYPAADHAPALIYPNPLAKERYVVLNSGHTLHEKELSSLNYLLFPRLGDWAMLKVGGQTPKDPSGSLEESVLRTGFFDEGWKFSD